jgi:hypothetical protein
VLWFSLRPSEFLKLVSTLKTSDSSFPRRRKPKEGVANLAKKQRDSRLRGNDEKQSLVDATNYHVVSTGELNFMFFCASVTHTHRPLILGDG